MTRFFPLMLAATLFLGPASSLAQPVPMGPGDPWFVPWGAGPAFEMHIHAGPVVLPPMVVPAESMYGPQAVRRFLGVDQSALPGPPARNEPRERPRPASNPQAVALAQRFIAFGDARFGEQKYDEAIAKYRKAIAAAPDCADGWFRLGWGLLATGRYPQAANAFKQGIKREPQWANSGFSLAGLYGENRMAQTAHIEALADAAAADRNNSDLLFLVGLSLHFDGQAERAAPFFRRARQLATSP